MNPIILIPARMASTRLPGKPLALIAGRPMILHVLAIAQAAALGPVAVACAEPEIAEAVIAAGGYAILTDPALPSGSDRIHAALQQLDPTRHHDIIINLQGDVPTLPPDHLTAVLEPLHAGYDIGTLVTACTPAEALSPAIVKAACAFTNAPTAPALYFSRAPIPYGPGPLWHHIGLYAYTRAALNRFVQLPPSPLEQRESLEQLRALEAGLRIGVTRVETTAFGIDTPADLDRVRKLYPQDSQA